MRQRHDGRRRHPSPDTTMRAHPGSELGIIGNGPDADALAAAARALGFGVRTFGGEVEVESEPGPSGGPTAGAPLAACLDDPAAAADALRGCTVVTSAVEHVPPATLAAAARAATVVRPSSALFAVAQDRALEREWLAARGVPLAAWRAVASLGDALDAFAALGGRCVLKPALRRGVAADVRRIGGAADLVRAFIVLGAGRCVLEEALAIDAELSVVVARTPGGELVTYPPAESRRAEHEGAPRLTLTVLPATVPPAVADKARRLAATVASRLGVEGILAVELFLLADGRLVVNEIVPCPHATFLAASHACATDQYEQLVRAVCDLPLGPTDVSRPVAVMPIYGDEWAAARPERVAMALRVPGVTMRRYGARAADDADPSARVAHLAAAADTSQEAVAKLLRARAWLGSNARGGARRPPRRERAGDTPQAV